MTDQKDSKVLFILIDDDDINNLISRVTIQSTWHGIDILTFESPVAALDFLQGDLIAAQEMLPELIILLNIHMPVMNGWEFLERFEVFADKIKARTMLYLLTSSIDIRDEERSRENKFVIEFLSKPLTAEMVLTLKEHAGK